MAHGDYHCCAICDSKMDYARVDARTKEDICTHCLKALRDAGVHCLDVGELMEWMKDTGGPAIEVLDRIGFSVCIYRGEIDELYSEIKAAR